MVIINRPFECKIPEWDWQVINNLGESVAHEDFDSFPESIEEWIKRLRANITPLKSRMFDAKKKMWQARKNTIVDENLLLEE